MQNYDRQQSLTITYDFIIDSRQQLNAREQLRVVTSNKNRIDNHQEQSMLKLQSAVLSHSSM
jgi:hypothetical protein